MNTNVQHKTKKENKEKIGLYDLVERFKRDESELIERVGNKLSECKRVMNDEFKCSLRTVKERDARVEIERYKYVNVCGLNVPIYVDCNAYAVFDSLKNDDRIEDGRHRFAVEQAINFYDGATMDTFFKGRKIQRQKPSMHQLLNHAFSLLEQSCDLIISSQRVNVVRREKEAEKRKVASKTLRDKQEKMKRGETVEPYTQEENAVLTELGFERLRREMKLPETTVDPFVLPITFYCRSGIYESLVCATVFYHAFKFFGWEYSLVDYASHQRSTNDNPYGRYPTKIYHQDLTRLVASYKTYREEKNKKAALEKEREAEEMASNDGAEECVVEDESGYAETEMDIVDE